MFLFWLLRNRFKENNFRNNHEVYQLETWLSIFKLSKVMFATYSDNFKPRNWFTNNLRANYENFDRIKDRKLAITFIAPNCTKFCWPQFVDKWSRNRSRLVSVSRSIQLTWFWPLLYKIFIEIEFLAKFMVFHKFFLFQNNQQSIANKIQATDFIYS